MQKVLESYLEVYRYDTAEEMAAHVADMESQGFQVQFRGEVYIANSSLVADYLKQENWVYQAEFYREL